MNGSSSRVFFFADVPVHPVPDDGVGQARVDAREVAPGAPQAPRHHPDEHPVVHYWPATVTLV